MVDLAPGQKLGRFLLEEKLGKGASGVVYRATDTVLSQPVALKVLHPWLVDVVEVRERFKREIVLTRRIVAQGVCRIHDLHEDDGLTYVTMELVEGKTLSEVIHDHGIQTPERTLEILRGLAQPLAAAHAAGVVHRDLKPGNIMIRPDGSVCVLDFGMATAQDVTKITQAGRTVGSLRFIAPEVWSGEQATSLSDQYAVGVVLYATMAGKLPYEAKTPAEAFAAQKQGPPSLIESNADVTPGIDAVVRRAMARKPQDRFANVEELCAAFERAVKHEDATGSTGTLVLNVSEADSARLNKIASATPARPPTWAIAAAVLALVVAGVVVVVVASSKSSSTSSTEALAAGDGGVKLAGADAAQGTAAPTKESANVDPAHPSKANSDEPTLVDPNPTHGSATAPRESAGHGSVVSLMKKRGIAPGDLPAVDALLAKAKKAEARGRSADASNAYDKARGLVEKAAIDRGFITAKQKRLNFAIDRAPASAQSKLASLQNDVEKAVMQRDYTGANDKLNRAFALVH